MWDSNYAARREIQDDVVSRLEPYFDKSKQRPDFCKLLRSTKLDDITEFGRAVHAEMDALLSCARCGISPEGGLLYTTTFPCHNCARHIIAAGICKVVYVEPYPKSRARDLHDDAITLDEVGDETDSTNNVTEQNRKVPFLPFVGVAPRRFIDLFSTELSSGTLRRRKENGSMVRWSRKAGRNPRVPMLAASYLEREIMAVEGINESMKDLEGENHGDEKKSGK